MKTELSADSSATSANASAPSLMRLAFALLAWSLLFSRPLLGPVIQALGLLLVWGLWWWRAGPTWPQAQAQLSASVGWCELILVIGVLALTLFVVPMAMDEIESRFAGLPVLTWAAVAIWILGVAYAVIAFLGARRRWTRTGELA